MLRPFFTASALALLLSVPVFGQALAPAVPTELEQIGLTPPTVLSQGYATGGEDVLVTALLGEAVYGSIEDTSARLGTITDMVVTSGLGISAVVISLPGVNAKKVAVDFSQLEWAIREDGSRRWVLATTAETLAAAPAFIWSDSEEVTGKPALTPQQEEAQLVDGDPNDTDIDPALTTDQPERQPITTPLDQDDLTPFDEAGLSPADLLGIGVYGADGAQIGAIGDVLLNPDGSFDAVIVDVGGFLGLGARPVAVAADDPVFSADAFGNRYLFLKTTRGELEAQPAYDPATYAAERNTQRIVIAP